MPTLKQKRAFKATGENGGNISKAMASAGYAPSVVHATEKLVNSKGWQELMDEYLPDSELAKVHKEGLSATKQQGVGGMMMSTNGKGKIDKVGHTEIEVPDYATRHKYLDTAYKLKGVYAPEKKELSGEIKTNTLTPEQIDKINEVALNDEG